MDSLPLYDDWFEAHIALNLINENDFHNVTHGVTAHQPIIVFKLLQNRIVQYKPT